MKPDTINAVGMILMAVFTIVVVFIYRTKPIKDIFWLMKVPMAIGGLVFSFILFALPTKRCVEIPEPFGQIELALLCILLLILFIDKITIIFVSCALIFITGGGLHSQFNELVRYSEEYTTIDANTHKTMAKGCSDMKSAEGIIAVDLWHTWFTGIYKIKKS